VYDNINTDFTFNKGENKEPVRDLVKRTYHRARYGNVKALDKLRKVAKKSGLTLKGRLEDGQRSRTIWSVAGKGHVPAYLAGSPMPQTRTQTHDRKLPTATLAISMGANASTSAAEIEAYATGVVAAIQTVTSTSRVQLAVYVCYAGTQYIGGVKTVHTCAMRVKAYDKPLNMSHAAGVMLDTAFYRLFGFSWFSLIRGIGGSLGSCSEHLQPECFDTDHRLVSITPSYGSTPVEAYDHVCKELRDAMKLQ
jgi:hypothetical protein